MTEWQFVSIEKLAALLEECSLHPDPPVDDARVLFLAAREEGEIAGGVGLEIRNDVGCLRSLAVREDRRGRGLGRQLVERITTAAWAEGCRKLVLHTLLPTYFAALGFTPITNADPDGWPGPDACRDAAQMSREFTTPLKLGTDGLIPAVAQDAESGQLLMLAYANREAILRTLETGEAHFYSRSRRRLWRKGETSGNVLRVERVECDCDGDALLLTVRPAGPACHTGERSCFHNHLWGEEAPSLNRTLLELWRTVEARRDTPRDNSYTTSLLRRGEDAVLKKVGEEAGEVIIAAKNDAPKEIAWEVSDLLYHLLVLLAAKGMEPAQVAAELVRRRKPCE